MQRISTTTKRKFLDLRAQGYNIREATDHCGISYPSGRALERRRMDGELQAEVRQAEQPHELAQLEGVLNNCLREIQKRGVENLNNAQLVNLTRGLPSLMKSLGSAKEESEDELDQIWKQLQREEEQNLEQQTAEGE